MSCVVVDRESGCLEESESDAVLAIGGSCAIEKPKTLSEQ
jgi:hypothetical protein